MYHANVNVKVMVENVIQIKGRIARNVDASVKTFIWNRLYLESCYM